MLKNNPTFIANTAKHYLFIQEVGNDSAKYLARGKAGFRELLTDLLTGKGTFEQSDWAWDEMFAFVEERRRRRCAIRCSARTGRWPRYVTVTMSPRSVSLRPRRAPRSRSTATSTSTADRTCSVRRWRMSCRHAFDFDLQVQLCTDLEAMPVDDATVEWPEKLSPFVTVGRVHLPRQDISRPENLEKGDALAFNQWRVTEEHRPLGEIMQVRRIYSASAKVRRALNHQPQTEPTSVDEVLSR